ncbi:TOBE domain-containing protein [Methylobacter sp.]|uniref:TOBE domain-containing protein n=1 Tax=Methylobacter sp. TaxID=2051955 RepID=UPI001219DD28|nr:TOBE domain-containing protein [Methylobacter sp.]TAK59762.1 MAG: LysR family transcriptional regulator [Methylobacter sp.]
MTGSSNYNNTPTAWVDGELRLAGLDSRIIGLLREIDQSGSINQAAKQVGLSYKGAWQIIERANNGAPKILVTTATGGSKGGGTCLTEAGRSLLTLFTRLEQQHQQFLEQLNRGLADDPDTVLLLQHLVVKTSARNQLFGSIVEIQAGAVNAEVSVKLKGGEQVIATVTLASLSGLGLQVGADAVLLINSADITLTTDSDLNRFSARNRLSGSVIRVQQDEVNAEVIALLPGGETLVSMITQQSAQSLALMPGMQVSAMFKSNAPVLGVMPSL